MKILKWILYIVLVIVALGLIIPLFLPSTVSISTGKEIAVSPAQVFHNVASFTDRDAWDPWLEEDPEAEFTLDPKPGYVGSEYTWNGKMIKTGRIVVDSVVFGEYIASRIYFGDDPDPGRVEWNLEESETGTKLTWKFSTETTYPVERLMMNLFKGQMKESLARGLQNLKEYLEENPPVLSTLSEITFGTIPPMHALVIAEKSTLEEMGAHMERMYGQLAAAVEAQQLTYAGAPFSHDLSFDMETGVTEYLAGIPVAPEGKSSGEIQARAYPAMKVIQAMHSGPYQELGISYVKILAWLEEKGIETTGESFEFYLGDPTQEPDQTKWQTLIALPLAE